MTKLQFLDLDWVQGNSVEDTVGKYLVSFYQTVDRVSVYWGVEMSTREFRMATYGGVSEATGLDVAAA